MVATIVSWIKAVILFPLSWLWGSIHHIRRLCYEYHLFRVHHFRVPVISVGNISFGGTGKTPFTSWLAGFCIEKGLVPLILTRGYRGKLEQSSGIIKAHGLYTTGMATLYGDEPVLLAQKLTYGAVVVGKKRVQNMTRYFAQVLPDVVILDDGYQHISLDRKLNIALFDASAPLSHYYLFPRGRLRESLTSLACADIVCLTRVNQVPNESKDILWRFLNAHLPPHVIKGEFDYNPLRLLNGAHKEVMNLDMIKGKEVFALTALASPRSFWRQLEQLGALIVEKIVYSDHYSYNQQEIIELLQRALERGAIILTTEKDMVKLRDFVVDDRLLSLEISLEWFLGKEVVEQKIMEVCLRT